MLLALLAIGTSEAPAGRPSLDLGQARSLSPGVSLYKIADPAQLSPPAPVSISVLRVDLAQADLRAVLANDEVVDTETVAGMAARHGAVAAINAGFFLPNGDPTGLLKLGGQLVSDARRPRGAVGILRDGRTPRLIFGRVMATMSAVVRRGDGRRARIGIDGVDTARRRGQLMLFTPRYHAHTGTGAGGQEWVVLGRPLRVGGAPSASGKTSIPKDGFVLSYGGERAPETLASLQPSTPIELETRYVAADGRADVWQRATEVVGGAGLLLKDGTIITDWSSERLNAGFADTRHPRTMIGTRADGSVWLVAVDGRQPHLSAGMTLVELGAFARRLGLRSAVNLDGGGSTTLWADGAVVNSPSDAAGPRKVSDALLVLKR